jgi:hypothetical protein
MNELDTILQWLPEEMTQRGYAGSRVYDTAVREEGEWYYIPIYVPLPDAYEKAVLLQSVEDEWETQRLGEHRILLIPAAAG